ncbi:MAG: hypothetical protein KF681_14850 [Bdellovibrionaceae bacterium]|nr:hypothetical protein [Pseudobdellovibrionaceae bacterium]
MKPIETLEKTKPEIPPWEEKETIKRRWTRFVNRLLQPVRRIQGKIRGWKNSIKHKLKRHYHLHLMLKYQEKHWRAEAIFSAQDRRSKTQTQITGLFESLPRRLVPLRREMEKAVISEKFDARIFRGQYCKMVRTYRGLSTEQVCRLLNSHEDILKIQKKHPALWDNYPFKPEFIEKFEERTSEIYEEQPSFGWFPPIGFPTGAFAQWLSKIYCAEAEYAQFQVWYEEMASKRNTNC